MAEHKENEIKEEINQKPELLKKIREFKDKKALAAVLQEELESCMASLNMNFNNQMKFNLVVQSKLEEIKKTNHVVSYVSFGIGAAGDGTTGIQTRQAKKFLQTPKDLVNFREYSEKNNYYLGSSHHEGNVAGSRDAIITSIKENFSLAMALQRDFVLYYTGHGSGNINMQGDWCFSDSSLSFADLVGLFNSTKAATSSIVVYIICDCCYSGQWVERWKQPENNNIRSWIRVIASCAHDQTCEDGVFSTVFFAPEPELTVSQVTEMNGSTVCQHLHKRLFKNISHGYINTHHYSVQPYTRTELENFPVKMKKSILEFLIKTENEVAVEKFLDVQPCYCRYTFMQNDAFKMLERVNWMSAEILSSINNA